MSGIVQGMKPGRATIETLTNHILNFETSRRADKERDKGLSFRVRLWGMAVAVGSSHATADETQAFLSARMVAHRELRRAARRLAKLALKQAEELSRAHVEHDALITRIIKLEAEMREALETMARDIRCAECGQTMTDHVFVTRCGGCGESYVGPHVRDVLRRG